MTRRLMLVSLLKHSRHAGAKQLFVLERSLTAAEGAGRRQAGSLSLGGVKSCLPGGQARCGSCSTPLTVLASYRCTTTSEPQIPWRTACAFIAYSQACGLRGNGPLGIRLWKAGFGLCSVFYSGMCRLLRACSSHRGGRHEGVGGKASLGSELGPCPFSPYAIGQEVTAEPASGVLGLSTSNGRN